MSNIPNRYRLVQPLAQILQWLLHNLAHATAVRGDLQAAQPDVAQALSLPRRHSCRRSLGLRPTVKHPRTPHPPDRLPRSASRQESALCRAPSQRAVWRQVSSSHNRKRARDRKPLIPANAPRSSLPLTALPCHPAALFTRSMRGNLRRPSFRLTPTSLA